LDNNFKLREREQTMTQATIQIKFEGGAQPDRIFEDTTETVMSASPGGERDVGDYLRYELKKELLCGDYYDKLPDIPDFSKASNAH
jgi:hypothetical protein